MWNCEPGDLLTVVRGMISSGSRGLIVPNFFDNPTAMPCWIVFVSGKNFIVRFSGFFHVPFLVSEK